MRDEFFRYVRSKSVIELEDETYEGKSFEFPARAEVVISRAGFHDCVFVGHVVARQLTVVKATFSSCKIHWKRALVNKRWLDAAFIKCEFAGSYIGNRFGHPAKDAGKMGSVLDCDFRQAHLDGCDFVGCDMTRIKLPSWPHFVLHEPSSKHQAELLSIRELMPRRLSADLYASASGYAETSAVVWSARRIAEADGISEDEVFNLVPCSVFSTA